MPYSTQLLRGCNGRHQEALASTCLPDQASNRTSHCRARPCQAAHRRPLICAYGSWQLLQEQEQYGLIRATLTQVFQPEVESIWLPGWRPCSRSNRSREGHAWLMHASGAWLLCTGRLSACGITLAITSCSWAEGTRGEATDLLRQLLELSQAAAG